MVIVYPHNQRFLLRRAHDVLVMKTCHALARAGHQVYLLMGRTGPDADAIVRYYGLEPHSNLRLVQLPILRGAGRLRLSWHGVFNHFCLRALRRIEREVGIDVLYLTEIKLAKFLLGQRRRSAAHFVYEVHGLYAPGYERPDGTEGDVFRRSDALVTTTASLQGVMEQLYGELPPRFRVPLASECPDDVSAWSAPPSNGAWRLCYVGQLYRMQGVETLVRALPLLPEGVSAEIVGGRPEQIESLRTLAGEVGAAGRVVFHGFVPPAEVAGRAAAADLFVAPCLNEKKMPYVAHTKLYEYLALGRPVVAADLPSVREEIEDGVSGALFRPGDPEALADAVRRVMADPVRAQQMAYRGRSQAQAYTWDARARGLVRCFEAVKRA